MGHILKSIDFVPKNDDIINDFNNNLTFDENEEDKEEYDIKNFLHKKRSFSEDSLNNPEEKYNYSINSNFTLSNNNISQPNDLDENDDYLYLKPAKLNSKNKSELPKNLNKSKFIEIKTNKESKIKLEEKNSINLLNIENEIPEINKENRDDNDKIKILRWIFKSFRERINGKIKNENLKLKPFDSNKVKENSKSKYLSLCIGKWKDITLDNSKDNENIIKNIYENNEKDAIELLEMNFCLYLDIFKENDLNQFLEAEKENQINRYKQKKYKEVIEKKEISEKNVQNLEKIKNCVTFFDNNKKGKNNLDKKEKSIIQDFEERNYKINKEEKFISFIKQIHQEISFELTPKEEEDIKNYIKKLENLFLNFDKWNEKKTGRNARKKTKDIFSINKNRK